LDFVASRRGVALTSTAPASAFLQRVAPIEPGEPGEVGVVAAQRGAVLDGIDGRRCLALSLVRWAPWRRSGTAPGG
jgi:hypothetical protein